MSAPRRYLPLTLAGLRDALAAGRVLEPADAVLAADDSEDAEYDALLAAADLSAALVAGLPDGQRRRVVVVVEGDAPAPEVPLARVAAVHADAADDADPDDDPGWYATQEIADLVASI